MNFKQLEITGFKSFSEKTNFLIEIAFFNKKIHFLIKIAIFNKKTNLLMVVGWNPDHRFF